MAQIYFDPQTGEPFYETSGGARLPILGPRAQALKNQRLLKLQQQRAQKQQPSMFPVNREAARQKIASARHEYGMQLKQLQKQRRSMTPERYREKQQEIKEGLNEIIGMIRETHGIEPRRENRGLTANSVDQAFSSTPVLGQPQNNMPTAYSDLRSETKRNAMHNIMT